MRTFLAWFALFLACLPLFAADAPALLEQGERAVQKKDFQKAAAAYEAAVKADPWNDKARLLLALIYAKLGRLEEAEQQTRLSLKLRPSYPAYENLGLLHAGKGDYEKAIRNYENALRLESKSYSAWYHLGLTQAAMGRFQRAIRCYQAALRNNPKLSDAYLGLGSAYYWAGDKATAQDQARILKAMHLDEKAAALEKWLQQKEAESLVRLKSQRSL